MSRRAALSLLLLAGCPKSAPSPKVPEAIAKAAAFSATQPRYLRPVPYTPVPKGLPDLRAATCGACHQAIYEEWRISTHARAWLDDAQFQAELHKSEKQGVGWMCMNCHTPLVNQLSSVVVGLEEGRWDRPVTAENPTFDPALQQDAITCATCHVRDGVVLGPYGDTGAAAPHPVRKDPSLRTEEVCTQCHQAQAVFDPPGVICVFDTGAEWARSPYAEEGEICQDCHMPEIERPIWTGGQTARRTRRHWFGGSLVPKHPKFTAELAALRAHYPPGAEVRLGTPRRGDGGWTVPVEIENARAGHALPTGDPERFLRVDVVALAADGATLASDRAQIGIVYEWHPKPKKISDNRLAPKEVRKLSFDLAGAEEADRIRVVASRWRISEDNLKYHDLEGRYVPGQVFFSETRRVRAGE